MPRDTKFRDLGRDPRFCLHTATVDAYASDGDAKVWGVFNDVQDKALHQRFATAPFKVTGLDLRGREFDRLYAADLIGASAVEADGSHLDITIWKPSESERVVRKH